MVAPLRTLAGSRVGGGAAVPERTGSLIVDVFDGQSKRMIWRATATDTLDKDPEDMFKKFSPKS